MPNPLTRSLQTFPGRLFVLSAVPLALLIVVQQFTPLPGFFEMLRRVAALGVVVSLVGLAGVALAQSRRRLLWRVRRKLILSYALLGATPVLLVGVFMLVTSWVLYTILVAYAFHDGIADLTDDVRHAAESVIVDLERNPGGAADVLGRRYEGLRVRYPDLSMTVVPASAAGSRQAPVAGASAGVWRHVPPPETLPAWASQPGGFSGVLAYTSGGEAHLLIRSALAMRDGRFGVIVDLPVDADLAARLEERTGTRIHTVSLPVTQATLEAGRDLPGAGAGAGAPSRTFTLFRQSVAFMDFVADWETGRTDRADIGIVAPLRRIVQKLSAPSAQIASVLGGVLLLLAVLLLIIQGSAFFMGGILVRSITSAIHELFAGTERMQQGDFAHRISIDSNDQLGDLASSFNRMGASIEHGRHVEREKQRLDDELRIAREIQKSLLPVRVPRIPGLSVADLCEPAREVGGDYYDFFEIGPGLLGVLVADVSGKGTSAALYMAELKGLMLALSHAELSPRRLLIDVNRRLVNQLDNRSFITMTYAVFDLGAGTMTCARAGHTPLIVVSAGESHVIVPSGMVVGLSIPGAEGRFEELLEDHTTPIAPGDLVVLYTDGITEAMDPAGELFGDEALARVLVAHQHLEPVGIRERVLREVRAFAGSAEQHDDMTMVVIKVGDAAGPGERR